MTHILRHVAPRVSGRKADRQAAILDAIEPVYLDTLAEFGIDTPLRRAHFTAQIAHESAGFSRLEEDLYYSAERLCEVWPSRFPTIASAQPYARNSRALANKVYGGRMGNTGPDDGWIFRGRGLKMMTGKYNYGRYGPMVGLDLIAKPDSAAEPRNSLRLGCAYWNDRRCSPAADQDDVRAVTYAINGGYNGLADRQRYLERAKAVIPEETKSRPWPETEPWPAVNPWREWARSLGWPW